MIAQLRPFSSARLAAGDRGGSRKAQHLFAAAASAISRATFARELAVV